MRTTLSIVADNHIIVAKQDILLEHPIYLKPISSRRIQRFHCTGGICHCIGGICHCIGGICHCIGGICHWGVKLTNFTWTLLLEREKWFI